MASRIPPLLEPYLSVRQESSLVLLTSVLGASSNWLVLRYLYSLLRASASGEGGGDGDAGVMFVSFLRDAAFWKEGAGKLGLDLDSLSRTGRYVYVDGLTGLSTGKQPAAPTATASGAAARALRSGSLADVSAGIEAALSELKTGRRVLVVDQMDALLAISDDVTSLGLQNMILSLREGVHATILTLSADSPLVHAPTGTTLEREHASLALSQAHAADSVLALRVLDTGSARDVSGVVRITPGGGGSAQGDDGLAAVGEQEEREYLYFVAGDGNVRVFERGA